jgi:acyl carrier protein
MEQDKILKVIQSVFKKFFKSNKLELTETSSAKDIDAWDSLNHMSLMGDIEREFNIQFEFFELMDFENIGDLIEGISSKLKK